MHLLPTLGGTASWHLIEQPRNDAKKTLLFTFSKGIVPMDASEWQDELVLYLEQIRTL